MILESPITLAMVNTYRGVVDFYYWKGVPVARAWPRPPRQPGTPAQQKAWNAMRDMFTWKQSNPYRWNTQWASMLMPATMSPEDARRKFGLRLAYAEALERPPDITLVTITPNDPIGQTTIKIFIEDYPEFDSSKVDFKVLGYDDEYKFLEWYQAWQDVNRQGVPTTRYEPIISHYSLPISESYSAALKLYELVIDGIHVNASIYGVVSKPTAQDIMLTPLYDSQDY